MAGDIQIETPCTDRQCTPAGPKQVWVGVKGLRPIPEGPYQLFESDGTPVGWTQIHPNNHYLRSEAISKLRDLGYWYSTVVLPFNSRLHINDASLERGGLFDIKGNWKPKHHERRRGSVVDSRANRREGAIPEKDFKEFEALSADLGIDAQLHFEVDENGKPIISTRHYHVRLLGIAE